jgi:predicted nucleotidyltransferase
MAITQAELDTIITLSKSYGATRLILFGSASQPDTPARDIDLACDGVDGWKLYELASRIEEKLHTPLDIVPLNPATRFTRLIESRGKVLL